MMVIIDYGVGNISSIQNMIKRVGGQARVSAGPEEIRKASALILPGVGAFEDGILNLRRRGFVELLNEEVLERKKPILGICVGMQLMTDGSDEGESPGLGWVKGHTKRLEASHGLKVPHMGWNLLKVKRESPLLAGLDQESRFYFVHSYYVQCENEADVVAQTEYGQPFTSILQKGNVMGVQFHPEKSHRFGMAILGNFFKMTQC